MLQSGSGPLTRSQQAKDSWNQLHIRVLKQVMIEVCSCMSGPERVTYFAEDAGEQPPCGFFARVGGGRGGSGVGKAAGES